MISIKKTLLLFIMTALFLTGCGESKVISEQRAKLELAEMKGDLDEIYLSLNRLTDAGDKDAKSRIHDITNAIDIREKMELALSDHDHENALIYASQLSKEVPNNKNAKKVTTSPHFE